MGGGAVRRRGGILALTLALAIAAGAAHAAAARSDSTLRKGAARPKAATPVVPDDRDRVPPRTRPQFAPVPPGHLQIYAASSIEKALLEIAGAYELYHPGVHVVSSFGGSAEVRAEIEKGLSQADVFISADTSHVTALIRGGLCDSLRIVGRNRLVVIGRKDGPVKQLSDLAMPGIRVAICAKDAPAGRYAERMLARMEKARGMGKGFVKRVRANLVGFKPSAREAVTQVALGEADAAFVYVTELERSKKKLVLVPTPDSLAIPTVYGAALVKTGKMGVTARDYLGFLAGPSGRLGLQHHGIQVP